MFDLTGPILIICTKCSDEFDIKDLPTTCKCGKEIKEVKEIIVNNSGGEIKYK